MSVIDLTLCLSWIMKARVKHCRGWNTVKPLHLRQHDFKFRSTAVHVVILISIYRSCRFEQQLSKLHRCVVFRSSIVENIKYWCRPWRKIPKSCMTTCHLGEGCSIKMLLHSTRLRVWCQARGRSLCSIFVLLWGHVRLWWLIHGAPGQ